MNDARQVGGDHYRRLPIQPWDAMAAWMTREAYCGFLRGNAIKYLAREKGGPEARLEDLRKAAHYIDTLIRALEPERPLDPAEVRAALDGQTPDDLVGQLATLYRRVAVLETELARARDDGR